MALGDAPTLFIDNPAKGETIGEVPIASAAEVKAAVARARAAQAEWGERPLKERLAVLRRVRAEVWRRRDDVAALLARENGKPRAEAVLHEVGALALQLTWLAGRAPKVLAPRAPAGLAPFPRATRIHQVPLGVVGIISPWNFPFLIPFSGAVEALTAGNAVVIKPSEQTPLVALLGKAIFEDAGLPAGLLEVVTGDASTGAALLESGVDKVCFTGSVSGGRRVAARCGELLVPCILELGGKAPLIVLPDADVARAASAIAYAGLANSGQVCIGLERAYVHESLYDDVLARVVGEVERLVHDDPERGDVDLGAMTLPAQLEHCQALVDDAVAKGARVATGGKRLERAGRFFAPTVLDGVTHEMRVAREEIFGPLIPLLRYRDVDEAVALANDSHLGLNAYVFGRDRARARAVAARIHAGQVLVNDVFLNYIMPELPFGGIKASGIGRVHGEEGLLAMCHTKVIVDDRAGYAPARDPTWFPYSGERTRMVIGAIDKAMGWLDLVARR